MLRDEPRIESDVQADRDQPVDQIEGAVTCIRKDGTRWRGHDIDGLSGHQNHERAYTTKVRLIEDGQHDVR